jgi:hypothetical protein
MWLIINKTFVRSFYLLHAGSFLFLFLVFFGIVAPSQQLGYHYALIRGMLEAPVFLALAALAWLLYAVKVVQFVFRVLDSPEGVFLCRLRCLAPGRCYGMLLRVQLLLFLPVSGYALAIVGVALYCGAWAPALLVLLYLGLICGVAASLYYRRLAHPRVFGRRKRPGARRLRHVPYWGVLLRFLLDDNSWLLLGIKLFSCGLLYLLLRMQRPEDYELRGVYFTYSMALFGHGILLFRCRRLEVGRMKWYRALPVALGKRLGQYCLFWLLLLVPEMLILGWMTPNPIRFIDVLELGITGYSLLILVSCCLMVIPLSVSDFLKLCLVIFGILYGCVLGGFLIAMSGFFLFTAAILFFWGYYRCELR